ncbi:MAG: right-handed parallel beta-helix repeat-containing protein [Actinomycetota bacterium]|nr:right-handed parallel beta-helix repeat-containing protein [Actinomycetota bacterium]
MTYRKPATFFALALLVAAAGVLVTAAPAEAATVTCGQVITQDSVLDADVGPCTGNGIVIGASNITLDLNGHAVFGSPATPTPPGTDALFPELTDFNGVVVTNPHRGVRVRNGTVSGFGIGVTIWYSAGNTIERLTVQDSRCHGIRLQGVQSGLSAADNAVRENVVRRNGCAGFYLVQNTVRNTLERNQVVANAAVGVNLQASGPNNAPRNNLLPQNLITSNGQDGASVSGFGIGNGMAGNIITANGANGVRLDAAAIGNVVQSNHIRRNAANGVVGRFGAVQNQITQNVAVENGQVIPGFDLAEENQNCNNTWTANTFLTRNRACIS